MRNPALPFVVVLLLSGPVHAQITWQPSTRPEVSAENTSWYQNAEPIMWNGDYYYPAGAAQGFNPYQMVRGGSFRGIPLYTDATLEPYSIVFVPLNGARMQPYERRRTGALAGTTGSRAPSLPTDIEREVGTSGIRGAMGPPDFARAYDLAPVGEDARMPTPEPSFANPSAGMLGRTRLTEPVLPVTTVQPPTGLNAIWIEFDGRRWYAEGKSIPYDASRLSEVGSYHGWTVYTRKGDNPRTIYIPSIPGRLAPYRLR